MGVKQNLNEIYKSLNDPFYQLNWIYNHFNQNVPHVSTPPTLQEYNLPDNIDELVAEEGKRIDKIIELIVFTLYAIGFIFVLDYVSANPDFEVSVWGVKIAVSFSYGLFALITYNIFFSGFVDDIAKRRKTSTSLYKRYSQFKDAQYAYTYWVETASLNYWMSLDGHQFEDAVSAVYRSNGYTAKVSKHGGDGGVDIVLEKDGHRIAVQCKAHKKQIGPSVARDLYGTMAHFGFDEGIIVSRSGFTAGVYDFVHGKPISLKTLNDLLRLQKSSAPAKMPKQVYQQQTSATMSSSVGHIPSTQKTSTANSSFIQNMEYKNNALFLTFQTGSTYCYYNVPESVYKEMIAAPSKGRFYHERIKDIYPYN